MVGEPLWAITRQELAVHHRGDELNCYQLNSYIDIVDKR